MGALREYDPELMRRAVELGQRSQRSQRSQRPVAHVARELGIGTESLRQAVRSAEAESGQRPELPTKQELEQIRRLKRENDELRRTNEVLTLASA